MYRIRISLGLFTVEPSVKNRVPEEETAKPWLTSTQAFVTATTPAGARIGYDPWLISEEALARYADAHGVLIEVVDSSHAEAHRRCTADVLEGVRDGRITPTL